MGLEFLARVRHASLWVGTVVALFGAAYLGLPQGAGFAVGVAWSLVNLLALQHLIVALTGPGRGTAQAVRRAVLALSGMLALFAAGAVALAHLPPVALVAGFLAPFAVMTLKAASLLILPTRAWRRLSRDPRLGLAVLAIVAAALWLAAAPLRTASSGARADAGHAGAPIAKQTGARADAGHAGAPIAKRADVHATAAGGAKAGEGAHGEEESGPQKFPNFITVLHRALPDSGWVSFLHHYEVIFFSMLVAAILILFAFLATRRAQLIPGPLQNLVEALVEALNDFVIGILGERHGPRYVPFLGSLFLYILAMNLFGLIPFMESPTSSLNVTVALALTVFLYSQWIGLRGLGIVGWLDHLAGNPRTAISWMLVPLMLPIHILGELAKPISLSCRLFGNVFGEDMLLVAFASLGVTVLSFTHLPFGLPLQLPFLFLALLTSTLQALVFTVLSTIYFLLMLPHDHGHEEAAQH
jgi:F-type H+-transporting ATPase subunit a